MVSPVDLASRKEALLSRYSACLPSLCAEHTKDAFQAFPPSQHAELVELYKKECLERTKAVLEPMQDQEITEIEKFVSGMEKGLQAGESELGLALRNALYDFSFNHRAQQGVKDICKKANIPVPILECYEHMPPEVANLPLLISRDSTGETKLMAHASFVNSLTQDELHALCAHEMAHLQHGDLEGIKGKKIIIKRGYEFAADAKAVELTGNPEAMVSALKKLDIYAKEYFVRHMEQQTAKYYKPNSPAYDFTMELAKKPFIQRFNDRLSEFFMRLTHDGSAHPPLSERIAKIEQQARKMAAGTWHPANETSRVWTEVVEKAADVAVRRI